jgi:hypothetical protein
LLKPERCLATMTKSKEVLRADGFIKMAIEDIKKAPQHGDLYMAIDRLRQAQDWIRSYRRELKVINKRGL